MNRKTAEAIASRIPGAEVNGGRNRSSVAVGVTDDIAILLTHDGRIAMCAYDEAEIDIGIAHQILGTIANFSLAIAAAVADGFPDPRGKE